MLFTVAVTVPVLPLISSNVNSNVPFVVNKLLYAFTHVIGSSHHVNHAVTSPFVSHVVLYTTFAVGLVLSIQVTVEVTFPVFQASSSNSYVKLPFPVNTYVVIHQLFVIVIFSLAHVNVEVTLPVVLVLGSYVTLAVGTVLSIQLTVDIYSHVFPAVSSNSNVNVQFHVNV